MENLDTQSEIYLAHAYYDEDSLLPWEYRSKKDLARRFLLSMSKCLSITILTLLNLETFSIIRTRELNNAPYPIIMILAILGGFIEPMLSCFPERNRNLLSKWNGCYQVYENVLLKLFTTSIFFCGFEPVSDVKNRYLPESNCVELNRDSILSLVGCLFPLSALSGFMEYSKYLKPERKYWQEKESCLQKKCSFFNPNNIGYRVIDSSVDFAISTISFLSTLSVILKLRTGSEMPLLAELIPTALLSILVGGIEYYKRDSNTLNKSAYFISEFMRPSLGNYYASIYLIFTIIPIIVGQDGAVLSDPIKYTFLPVAYLIALGFNYLRASDATWYKFVLRQENPIPQLQTTTPGGTVHNNGSVQIPYSVLQDSDSQNATPPTPLYIPVEPVSREPTPMPMM